MFSFSNAVVNFSSGHVFTAASNLLVLLDFPMPTLGSPLFSPSKRVHACKAQKKTFQLNWPVRSNILYNNVHLAQSLTGNKATS